VSRRFKYSEIYRTSGSLSGGYEQLYLVGYNSLQSIGIQPMFQRNILLPSSRSKSSTYYPFDADFLYGLFLDAENTGDISLRNVGLLSTKHVPLYPRKGIHLEI
jgi:hypothetical protein